MFFRFASTLSAEAQVAVLGGYDDAVSDKLHTSYPALLSDLPRPSTPTNINTRQISSAKVISIIGETKLNVSH